MCGRRPLLTLCVCLAGVLLWSRPLASQPAGPPAHLLAEAREAAERFDAWLQPRSLDALRIEEVPWFDRRAGTLMDGRLLVPRKWLASSRDRAASRALITALSEWYFEGGAGRIGGVVSDGIRQYVATRAIHQQLVTAHYFCLNWFGGFVTHAIRSIELSRLPQDPRPPVRRFAEVTQRLDTERVVDAMFTLERYIGWPAVQHAVADWLHSADRSVQDFDNSLWRATAQDLRWFTSAAFDARVRYDYAVTTLSTIRNPEGRYETTVTVTRAGNGIFPVDVETTFADGIRLRDRWVGHEQSVSFKYTSRSAATAAVVDPDLVLLLDEHRANNARVLEAPVHVPAIRWTLQWAIWLQDVLLTTTALM